MTPLPIAGQLQDLVQEGICQLLLSVPIPLAFLLLMGNRLSAPGFRWPGGRWWLWAPLGPVALWRLGAVQHLGPASAAPVFSALLIGTGLSEELLYRAGIQTRLHLLLGDRALAVVLASWLFALMHLGTSPAKGSPMPWERSPPGCSWG